MASTHFAFSRVANPGTGHLAVADADADFVSETLTPGAGNTQTTITAPLFGEKVMARVATDTLVFVTFGASPNATTAGRRFMCPANSVSLFTVNAGDKGACSTT
jgi:hypothetical protein